MIRASRWLAALAPLGIGVCAAIFFASGLAANPILFLKADLGTLCLLCGAALSGLSAAGLVIGQGSDARQRKRLARARTEAVTDKHRFLSDWTTSSRIRSPQSASGSPISTTPMPTASGVTL